MCFTYAVTVGKHSERTKRTAHRSIRMERIKFQGVKKLEKQLLSIVME